MRRSNALEGSKKDFYQIIWNSHNGIVVKGLDQMETRGAALVRFLSDGVVHLLEAAVF